MKIKRKNLSFKLALATMLTLALTIATMQVNAQTKSRPNILLIVADDLGYSDLGSYGGEINTPVLDQLAQQGMRYTDFYVAPTCSVTRSMLLSGTDSHVAGMGNMASVNAPNQQEQPGYEGALNTRVASIAELMQEGGYHTYMAGKWHLGYEPEEVPHARGFERDFVYLGGGADHFSDGWNIEWQRAQIPYFEDGKPVKKLPEDFYSSKNYTDKTIQFIDEGRADGKPFFAYMAFTAPHGPLQVPDDWLRRYKNRYDEGWDTIRHERLARMQELGIVDKDVNAAPRAFFVPRASQLAIGARKLKGREMEIYASMVEYLDDQIGRVFDHLKEIGEYDNTVVIFISDNGAEGTNLRQLLSGQPGSNGFMHAANSFAEDGHNSIGRRGTFAEYGPAWAQVGATPFRMYKGFVAEGGIRSPLIVSGPGVKGRGEINKEAVIHVKDIVPTILEMAGIEHPSTFKGREIAPVQGKSWVNMLAGKTQSPRSADDWLGWELFGNRAIRQGDWKISWLNDPFGTNDWQLFNLSEDLGEQRDLSAKFPEKKKELIALWDEYVETNGVIIGNRSMVESFRKGFPDRKFEADNYPPVRGMEAIPHKKLLQMIKGSTEDKE